MIINMPYWSKVIKNIICVILIILALYGLVKLSFFYMPFLVALIISLIIEPIIKKIMKKTKLSRRLSSIIVFLIVSAILIGSISWIVFTLIAESSNLLDSLNEYIDKSYTLIKDFLQNNKIAPTTIQIPQEILNVVENSANDVLSYLAQTIRTILTKLFEFITSLPSIFISITITIIALYFICVDKIYIIDQVEHHLPSLWVKKIGKHFRELTKTLGGYLKAEAILVIISFIISLIGLYILDTLGYIMPYPLLMALLIGFVDALPIFGSGTIMIPWAIISYLNGDYKLGIGLIILLIIMSITRQVIEPKIVSKNIGVHPIFTLIAMYTGYRLIGVTGLLIGPIALIIVKNIFSNLIEQGVFKTIFNSN